MESCKEVSVAFQSVPNQEGFMSLHYTYQKADRQDRDYGFILALVCMALAIVVASAIFAPAPVGSGINFSEITTTGL
jgi:hypothetical protein